MTGYAAPRHSSGVAMVAVATGVFGGYVLLAGVVVTLVALLLRRGMGWTAAFGSGVVAGVVALLVGAAVVAIAYGLWGQERWAYVTALMVSAGAVGCLLVLPLLGGAPLMAVRTAPGLISAALLVALVALSDKFW